MTMPCSCCPTEAEGCALVAIQFDSVAEIVPEANWTPTNLGLTIDGDVASFTNSGYTTVIGNTPSTVLRVAYGMATPQNRVRGIRIWNQCGSNLNDGDGLNRFTAEFYAGAVLLATQTWQVGNGGAPQTRTLPNGLELNDVDSVVLRTMDKQIGSNVAPLWREFQLLEFQPVFPCRRPNGAMEWYDTEGNQVTNADVVGCDSQAWEPDSIVMTTSAFGDDVSGIGENLCNVVPLPASTVGFAPVGGGCYDPALSANSMTWGPTSSIEMEYNSSGAGSGAAVMVFTVTPGGTIQWPASAFQMEPGDTVLSNLIPGGRRAVLTYVSGPPASSPSGTLQPTGGGNIRVHGNNISSVAPIRFRIDFVEG